MEDKTCDICGHTGEDVHPHHSYLGGVGYITRTECDNEVECWARIDEQQKNKISKELAEYRVRLGVG